MSIGKAARKAVGSAAVTLVYVTIRILFLTLKEKTISHMDIPPLKLCGSFGYICDF